MHGYKGVEFNFTLKRIIISKLYIYSQFNLVHILVIYHFFFLIDGNENDDNDAPDRDSHGQDDSHTTDVDE